jgi:FMN phosphatase YigB (HAD superfamily)
VPRPGPTRPAPRPLSSPPRPAEKKTARKRWLLELLDAVACGDEVPHGKPAPDVFLEAARRLGGVAPGACLVFEDAPSGVEVRSGLGWSAGRGARLAARRPRVR